MQHSKKDLSLYRLERAEQFVKEVEDFLKTK